MNAAERREVRRVKALVLAGNRSEALASLRRLEIVPARAIPVAGQMLLRFATFRCDALAVEDMPAHVCVTRQAISEAQRTQQNSRGQGSEYPSCDSRRCAQGRAIREALDPRSSVTWRGVGPGGRFTRIGGSAAQEDARRRLARAGLLDEVRTMDADPGAVESKGRG